MADLIERAFTDLCTLSRGVGLDDLEVVAEDLVKALPTAVGDVVEHPLDTPVAAALLMLLLWPAKARSNDLRSAHQISAIACAFGSGKMSSRSAPSASRMLAATSAGAD